MSHAQQVLTLIGSVGAALAAVVYAGRQARKVMRKLDTYLALPEEVTRLRAAVAQNTMAIGRLSSLLDQLVALADDSPA